MYDLEEYRCPSCNSTDVARIETPAIYDELMECHSCKRIFEVEYADDGTAQPVAV